MKMLLIATVLICGTTGAVAQSAPAAKIDPAWLRADAGTKTVTVKLVAGLTDANGGMNFNGFTRGGLVLTVPASWTVVLHFTNQDPNLPHSVEVIPAAEAVPSGAVAPAFEHATTGRLDQGLSSGQSADMRFVAGKAGSFLIFCAVPAHGSAGMWIRLVVSATADKPSLTAAVEH